MATCDAQYSSTVRGKATCDAQYSSTVRGMGTSALPQLQRRRDSAREDHGAAQAREEARGLAWLVTV